MTDDKGDDPLDVATVLRRAYGEARMDPALPDRIADALGNRSRRRAGRPVLAITGSVLLAGALAAAIIVTLPARSQRVTQAQGSEEVPSTGPAVMPPGSNQDFVWFQGTARSTPTFGSSCNGSSCTGSLGVGAGTPSGVYVIDWTGKLRYHFQLPSASAAGDSAVSIQAVSLSGTRALLSDGTVLDETGKTVGSLPSLTTSALGDGSALWATDGSGVCSATVDPSSRGVTVRFTTVTGQARVVATVGAGDAIPVGVPTTIGEVDTAQILACSPTTDRVVVVRYHEPVNGSDGFSSTIWALRLSTGAQIFHQPEVSTAGIGLATASANGQVIAEQPRWESPNHPAPPVVVDVPLARPITSLGGQPVTSVVNISADGNRILLDSSAPTGEREVAIIDSSTGRVIWRVAGSWEYVAAINRAADEPATTSFMAQLAISPTTGTGEVLLLDGNGGVTILKPPLPPGTALSLVG